ncbi:asparagine synthetase B family protein [Shewanella sp. HN-41]|uniref:asparagine synthetase B family protein n=1 Tax=Shewanella sp. HN-41 TaxID=327275 RepID=UPI0002125F28|nr:asparagine synthase-related protein [Shewanella sp. HN-41]EGM69343.1 asparagine synthase (glutamine-hydrolyzing) [Shewanella sp. HN-41]
MSTIHCAIDWQTSLPENAMQEMLACSDYWQPDAVHVQQISHAPDVRLAKACLYNRPNSEQDAILVSECGQFSIVANAHLDNRDELALQLHIKDIDRLCDGELIIKAYQRWQENTASHLLGDFVFILWDKVKQQVYCARDHFGVKSLFYAIQSGRVIVSNEHKSLLVPSLVVSRQLSHRWLADVFMPTTGNEFLSPFDTIHTLPAAHQLVINQQGHSCEAYWSLKPQVLPKLSDDEYIARLAELFEQAVARRLVSQYPIAAELSEGLDSNGVVGYASRLLGDKPLYTMSFDGESLNKQNAALWGPVYQELFDAIEQWPNVQPLWHDEEVNILRAGAYVEAFGGPSAISSWFDPRCSLAQSKGCKTVLSGWGGDHCVSGYGDEYIQELFLGRQYIRLYRQLMLRQQRGRGGKPIKALLRLFIQHQFPQVHNKRLQQVKGLAKQSADLFHHSILTAKITSRLAETTKPYYAIMDRTSVQARDHRELIEVGVQRRMTLTEIAARHHRCEFRYPMLDKELVEFAYSLPSHLKCKHGIERYMFREILKGHTTERIRMRRKADVLTSIDYGKIRASVNELLNEVFTHWSLEVGMIFNREALEQAAQNYPHVMERHLLSIKSLQQQLESGLIHL